MKFTIKQKEILAKIANEYEKVEQELHECNDLMCPRGGQTVCQPKTECKPIVMEDGCRAEDHKCGGEVDKCNLTEGRECMCHGGCDCGSTTGICIIPNCKECSSPKQDTWERFKEFFFEMEEDYNSDGGFSDWEYWEKRYMDFIRSELQNQRQEIIKEANDTFVKMFGFKDADKSIVKLLDELGS